MSVPDCIAHPPLSADRPVPCDSVAAATSLFKLYLSRLCSCGGIPLRTGSLGPQSLTASPLPAQFTVCAHLICDTLVPEQLSFL